MTTMHGPEAIRIMRERLDYKGLIIGVTGNFEDKDIAKLIGSGADGVITKPLTVRMLKNELTRLGIFSSTYT